VPFLRLTRDQRGYENTFLLHVNRPGERPRILYWYRSAPGVRVGRPALDEDAIRTIEEQHPEIEFDWPQILEAGTLMAPEIERRPERPRRKPVRPREADIPATVIEEVVVASEPVLSAETDPGARMVSEPSIQSPPEREDLLSELVGREIASRLRARYTELRSRLQSVGDKAQRHAC
jgi:hypothetical protein